jgi:hypothetical protein
MAYAYQVYDASCQWHRFSFPAWHAWLHRHTQSLGDPITCSSASRSMNGKETISEVSVPVLRQCWHVGTSREQRNFRRRQQLHARDASVVLPFGSSWFPWRLLSTSMLVVDLVRGSKGETVSAEGQSTRTWGAYMAPRSFIRTPSRDKPRADVQHFPAG